MELINFQEYWDDIYTKNKPEEVSWFQKEPAISLNLIQRLVNNKAQIIDVGGGASVLKEINNILIIFFFKKILGTLPSKLLIVSSGQGERFCRKKLICGGESVILQGNDQRC